MNVYPARIQKDIANTELHASLILSKKHTPGQLGVVPDVPRAQAPGTQLAGNMEPALSAI
jgi:hypothetical protein